MINVVSNTPSALCSIGTNRYLSFPQVHSSCRPYVIGRLLVVAAMVSKQDVIDPFVLTTTRSKSLENCNDCYHAKAEGNLQRTRTDWYEHISGDHDRLDSEYVKVPGVWDYSIRVAAILDSVTTMHSAYAELQDFEVADWPRKYVYKNLRFELVMTSENEGKIVASSNVSYHNLYSGVITDLGLLETTFIASVDVRNSVALPRAELEWPLPHPEDFIPNPKLMERLRAMRDEQYDYGDLTRAATAGIRALDINTIAYIKDMAEIFSLAKSLMSLISPWTKWSEARRSIDLVFSHIKGKKKKQRILNLKLKEFVKLFRSDGIGAVAETYLASHYGLRLTIFDTQSIADAIDSIDTDTHQYQTAGGDKTLSFQGPNGNDVECKMHLKATIASYANEDMSVLSAMMNIGRALYDLDVVPTLSNLWDMVPMSFIVDWFLPVGDMLEQREQNQYACTLRVRACHYSSKWSYTNTERWSTEVGDYAAGYEWHVYERTCLNSFIVTPPRFDPSITSSDNLGHHWLESLALITSRAKRP